METDGEGGANGEKRHVSVSYQKRPCSPLSGSFLIFSISCSAWNPTQIMVSEVLGMSLNNQLYIVVRLRPARTNSTDPTVRFNSL